MSSTIKTLVSITGRTSSRRVSVAYGASACGSDSFSVFSTGSSVNLLSGVRFHWH